MSVWYALQSFTAKTPAEFKKIMIEEFVDYDWGKYRDDEIKMDAKWLAEENGGTGFDLCFESENGVVKIIEMACMWE